VYGSGPTLTPLADDGFDTSRTLYRGLTAPYDPNYKSYYQTFSSSVDDASEYGPHVIAAHIRPGKNLSVDAGGNNFNVIPIDGLPAELASKLRERYGSSVTTDQLAHAAREAGFNSLTVKNVHDTAWGERLVSKEPKTVDFVFDQNDIKTINSSILGKEKPYAEQRTQVKLSDADRVLLNELFADQVEGMANRAGYTLQKPANVFGSGPTLTPLMDEADGGLIAYHGSPHTFDKFSMDKIGTGEGAQAYGHGLYFAEAEDVAKTYRDMLSDQPQALPAIRSQQRMDWTEVQDDAYTLADKALEELQIDIMQGGSSRPNWSRLTDKVRQLAPRGKEDEIASALDELANRYGWKDFVNRNPGSMYQVRLNVKPDELVDWDKPLHQQSNAVRSAILSDIDGAIDITKNNLVNASERLRPIREAGLKKLQTERNLMEPLSGQEIYQRLSKGELRFSPQATEQLKAAGIKGIRYKDAVSRSTEGGTYNYVIFDDSLITILKRYGIPMTAAAGGGMMVMGQDMPPEVASQIGG
jgi:hypothetical protein